MYVGRIGYYILVPYIFGILQANLYTCQFIKAICTDQTSPCLDWHILVLLREKWLFLCQSTVPCFYQSNLNISGHIRGTIILIHSKLCHASFPFSIIGKLGKTHFFQQPSEKCFKHIYVFYLQHISFLKILF